MVKKINISTIICLFILSTSVVGAQTPAGPPKGKGSFQPSALVELVSLDPTIKLDIRYATANNFVGRAVYPEARAFLQRSVAEALVTVHHWLKDKGYGLVIYDAYRPWSVTKLFWDVTPPEKRMFVADPAIGSVHNRGCAVDVGLYDLKTDRVVEMPGAYDEMSERSFVTYPGGTPEQRTRRDLLREAMERGGCFFVYPEEWWHYDFKDFMQYEVLDTPFSALLTPTLAPAETTELFIARAADALQPKLVEIRRDLHMYPELANRETRTSHIVAERLKVLGLEVKTGYGVVAILKGTHPGPVVAIRADMDALPIQEVRDIPYKSKVDGVMHACGHDVHTTIGLGTAEVLAGMRDRLWGTVKFIFQPAEEDWPDGLPAGAVRMVQEGVLENPRPAGIFGLHVFARPVGEVSYEPNGRVEASCDDFAITVRGKLTHGAKEPQNGVDAIVVAAECVTALQTIHSRKMDPMQQMSLAIGTIQGGKATNIMADEVKLAGTLRTLDPDLRDSAKQNMRTILAGITAAHGASYELAFSINCPMLFNDRVLTEASVPSLRKAVGASHVVFDTPDLGSEDFAFFSEVIPGFYFNLGVFNKEKGIQSPIHTGTFDVDENCLAVGVKAMSNLVVDFLEREAKKNQ